MLLAGKNALITGAASGIGEATAKLFVEEGARVLLADINFKKGELLAQELRKSGGDAQFVHCDVTDEKDVKNMVAEAVARLGALDCAVNNAGILGVSAALDTMTLQSWQQMIDVNLTSVFLCLKYELREMKAQGFGSIVNIASGAGVIPVPNKADYCAAKHGVLGLTKTAATENLKSGVRVNAVLPGCIETPMLQQSLASGVEVENMVRDSIPCGRFGRPQEVAQSVLWLCSDRASYVSGISMLVDYGTVCR